VRSVRPEDAYVGHSVAVIICRYRLIARDSESGDRNLPIRRPYHVPCPRRRSINSRIRLPIAVIIRRSRDVACSAEREGIERKVLAPQEEPLTRRRPEERHIRLPIAGVIRRSDHVRFRPEHRGPMPAIRTRPVPPLPTRWPEYRYISLRITIKIEWCRYQDSILLPLIRTDIRIRSSIAIAILRSNNAPLIP